MFFWSVENSKQNATTLGLPRLHDKEEIQQFAKEFPGEDKKTGKSFEPHCFTGILAITPRRPQKLPLESCPWDSCGAV